LYEKSYNKSSAVQLLLRWPRIRPHCTSRRVKRWVGMVSFREKFGEKLAFAFMHHIMPKNIF